MDAKTFRLDEDLGYLCTRAARAVTNALNRRFAEAGLGLTAEQWRLLTLLWAGDGRTQRQLAEGAEQEKTGISRLVDGLELRSLVVRSPDRRDKRSRRVYLTLEGKRLRDQCFAEVGTVLEQARAGIGDGEWGLCRDVLRRVFVNLAGAGAGEAEAAGPRGVV